MKRVLIVVSAAGLILIVPFVYRLGLGFGLWQPLRRPQGVPPQARYVVTVTRSAWFDCRFNEANSVDLCRAWNDAGKLVAYGKYRLEGENRGATAAELRPSMVEIYPGHPELACIYLRGKQGIFAKTLVPVNSAGRPLERFDIRTGQR